MQPDAIGQRVVEAREDDDEDDAENQGRQAPFATVAWVSKRIELWKMSCHRFSPADAAYGGC